MKDVEVELSGCKDCFGAKETAWQPLFGSLKAFQGTCQFTTMVADTAQSWRGRQGSGFGTKCWWLMTSQTTFQERIYRILESRNPALPLDLQTLLALQLQKLLAMVSTEKKKHLTSDILYQPDGCTCASGLTGVAATLLLVRDTSKTTPQRQCKCKPLPVGSPRHKYLGWVIHFCRTSLSNIKELIGFWWCPSNPG